jgi:hypothetical protein
VPIDIPASLVAWLLEGQATKAPKGKAQKVTPTKAPRDTPTESEYEYDLNDEQVWDILGKLPDEYLTNRTKWLTVTSILKSHGRYEIWREWSKRGGNYDEVKNQLAWDSNKDI